MNASVTCDVCGLPDPYDGTGDGIGSCECICPPDDIDGYQDDDFLSYLPSGRVEDMLRNPGNRHLY